MPSYSASSLEKLSTCVLPIQRLMLEVVKHRDNSILEGFRGEELQHKYFLEKKSKLDWPNGNHNKNPSQAVDSVPYPIDWTKVTKDDKWAINAMCEYAGFVLGVAAMMEIPIRWGGDWDGDGDLSDQQFHDLPHYETIE